MIDMTYDSQIAATTLKAASETSPIETQHSGGDAVNMLLAKLDEGTQTIINLRSILTLKTAELNELLAQLELTNQAITTVENTTTQIENMLKDFGLSTDNSKESLLISAEASLDSAIKTATSIYPQQFKQQSLIRRPSTASTNSGSAGVVEGGENKRLSNARLLTTRIRYKPDTKHILRKLNDLVRDLGLDSGKFFSSIGTTDDFEVLQRAYVDLDIAKTISLSAKSNMKRRNILMRSARRRNNLDEIEALGEKIREGVALWTTYTRNTPLLINGEDIIAILDREDDLLAKNLPVPASASYGGRYTSNITVTPSTSSQTKTSTIKSSLSNEIKNPTPPPKRNSRISSIPLVDTLPVTKTAPSSPALSPIITANNTVKKPQRPASGVRLTQVKASVGLPRVRTTSITQQKEQQTKASTAIISATTREAPTTKSTSSLANSSALRQTHIPLPPSYQQQAASPSSINSPITTTSSNLATDKKSLLKPPAQRGPGSTLRLRSMLAKRGQLPTPSSKPPTS